jgi:hypothetical protein
LSCPAISKSTASIAVAADAGYAGSSHRYGIVLDEPLDNIHDADQEIQNQILNRLLPKHFKGIYENYA